MPKIRIPYDRFSPEYDTRAYSRLDALSFALASYAVYRRPGAATRQFEDWGFDTCEFFNVVRGRDVDTQGIVARSDKVILAAFRGSESKADWNANLQAVKDPGPLGGGVHEGFQDAFHAATFDIGNAIGRLRDNNQQVWITGHSLGGALAVLLAATLSDAGPSARIPVSGLYTFGSPRVGDKRFAKKFDQALKGVNFRVVNLADLVPHLPVEMRFSHGGNRVLFFDSGKRSYSRRFWVEAKEKMWGWIGKTIGSRRLVAKDAHLLDSDIGYLKRLIDDIDRPHPDSER